MAKKIDSSWIDGEMATDAELSSEASTRAAEDLTFVKLDGTRKMTGALDMDSHKISNVTNPTSAQDACTKSYADAIIPSQTGNTGKYLKTDGTTLSWDTPSGGGGSGDTFNTVTTDFGTNPIASGTDTLNFNSADNARYYFTGDATTDTVTLTVTGLTPPGGDYGQVLSKASGTNYDVEWSDGVLITKVYNNSGATITKGSVVYISGASGNLPTIALSKADTESTSSKTYGFVVGDISNNSSGAVVHGGQIKNLDTFGVTEGVTLWLSPSTAGAYTTTKPSAPDHMVSLGVCTRAHATLGTIEVSIQNGFEIQELHNVSITTPADKQFLAYESATSLWKNTTPGNLTESTSSVLTITGGTSAVLSSASIQVKQSSASQSGFLSSTDWNTFNNKQATITGGATSITTSDLTASRTLVSDASGKVAVSATTSTELGYVSGVTSAIQTQLNGKEPTVTKGNLTESTSSVLTITGGTNAVIGSGTSIQVKQATTSVSGYLSSTDWTTFNNKPSLTATTPSSIASTNILGTATTAAKADHQHQGVLSLAKSGSTALYGAVTLSAGSNITLTQSGNDISIASTASGGGGMSWLLFSWEQRPGAGSSYQIVIPQSITITSASTKYAKCTTAATGSSAVFTIYKNGSSVGTVTFSTAATSGTFSITSDISLAAGDLLKITAPTTQNADLQEVAISLPWQ